MLWLYLCLAGEWAAGAAIYHQDSTTDMVPKELSFLEDPNFFDYPDSAQDKILAISRLIGEKPVYFTSNSGVAKKSPKKLDQLTAP
ncbi:fertilization-influencing membrane protein isoform X2 [Monodelphis domestica]|uniref:fertilization-influencing membrane protein isoform X2 n=1 Tax=Monodelphis domestica TaxID=13616 RepID=UPI0024E23116|nr:fertilization-influencing membrane protein isoform X2 [Monodelphis domestica]